MSRKHIDLAVLHDHMRLAGNGKLPFHGILRIDVASIVERIDPNYRIVELRYLPYRCAIDEFEHTVHEDIAFTKAQRCELWRDIELKYMPWRAKSSQESVKRGTSWQNQPHLFNYPFSYIDYNNPFSVGAVANICAPILDEVSSLL
ncbi:M3 family oligoendopeptidase [Paenibacillus lycopersici]|uniref:M3 family oligoendopeptidase n=1 Tax=Paenibacillus lycopersici TaxID=2704462 RepID=A0A6C0G5A2_9BACL|nr:M3 family oligoendopeptidase [Paenibacillus lycopersici]QHT62749.1 M3 family oligoendopeptidase [Paenibacillus lycopersici]